MSLHRRKRRTPEQIIAHWRQAEGMLSAGLTLDKQILKGANELLGNG